MNATLFVTCLADTFYPEAAVATLRVLRRLGYHVRCPDGQTCCGQPMFNAGHFDQSSTAARHFVDVFRDAQGPIIGPSSSCVAMVRQHYDRLFADDPAYRQAAAELAKRTFEFSEFLVKHVRLDPAAMGARFNDSVTYHYSCHFRPLGIVDEPISLIQRIPGIDYRPLERLTQCCGFGGTFSVNFPHVSEGMVRDKVDCIRRTGANWLIFSDAGCAMNITGYANRTGQPIQAMHLAQLIDQSLGT